MGERERHGVNNSQRVPITVHSSQRRQADGSTPLAVLLLPTICVVTLCNGGSSQQNKNKIFCDLLEIEKTLAEDNLKSQKALEELPSRWDQSDARACATKKRAEVLLV